MDDIYYYCMLYQVVMSGLVPEDRTLELYMEDVPLIAPGAPVTKRQLEEFTAPSTEGFVLGLTPSELTRLDTGVVHFEIRDTQNSQALLRARWRQVRHIIYCIFLICDSERD